MKIIIDTTQEYLFVLLMDKDFKTVDKYLKIVKKKSDILSSVVSNILLENKITMKNIKEIYVTTGPGSFMGARAGLMFARTIAQTSNIKLFTGSSFELISCGMPGDYLIDAKGNTGYWGKVSAEGKLTIELVETTDEKFTTPLYQDIIKEPMLVTDRFVEVKDLSKVEPLYIKEPRIGGN